MSLSNTEKLNTKVYEAHDLKCHSNKSKPLRSSGVECKKMYQGGEFCDNTQQGHL